MALLSWSNDISIGIPSIDKEHMALLNAINELYEAVTSGEGGREQTGLLLRRVVECTRSHFSSEEAMLAASNYPEWAEHSQQH